MSDLKYEPQLNDNDEDYEPLDEEYFEMPCQICPGTLINSFTCNECGVDHIERMRDNDLPGYRD